MELSFLFICCIFTFSNFPKSVFLFFGVTDGSGRVMFEICSNFFLKLGFRFKELDDHITILGHGLIDHDFITGEGVMERGRDVDQLAVQLAPSGCGQVWNRSGQATDDTRDGGSENEKNKKHFEDP